MASLQQSLDAVSPPLLAFALMFLDPRRWLGALIALIGVLVSVVAPFLPKFLLGHLLSEPAASASAAAVAPIPLRQVPMPRRPLPTPAQSIVPAVSPSARTRPRPRTAGDSPLPPHVTFSPGCHPRRSASSLIATSCHSNSLATDSSFSHLDSRLSSLPSSPAPASSSLPPTSPMPYVHPLSLPSVESLTLATDAETLMDKPLASPCAKRQFRVPMPKLGFRRHGSTTDISTLACSESNVPALASDCTQNPQNPQQTEVEWHGTSAFAIRRGSVFPAVTLPSSCAEKATPLSNPRRKFSIFTRESPSSFKNSPLSAGSLPIIPASQSFQYPSRMTQPPPTLPTMMTSPPANSVVGPSRSHVVSFSESHADYETMIPLELTTTPPPRPARTDPYKTYGVPVPGSDRALAFLKAEKERIRAEKERKERERAIRERDGRQEAQREDVEGSGRRCSEKQVDVEKVKRQERRFSTGISKKGKEVAPALGLDLGNEADGEDDKMGVEEFGVLSSLISTSAIPQGQAPVRPSSSHGKRGWVFSRRNSQGTGGKGEKRREKETGKVKLVKDKSKSKDPDAVASKARPKSRDGSKKAFGFRSKDTSRNKDRGYSSDTGVPSLTYKLM